MRRRDRQRCGACCSALAHASIAYVRIVVAGCHPVLLVTWLLAMPGTFGVVSSLYDEANASTKYSIVDCNELALGSGGATGIEASVVDH